MRNSLFLMILLLSINALPRTSVLADHPTPVGSFHGDDKPIFAVVNSVVFDYSPPFEGDGGGAFDTSRKAMLITTDVYLSSPTADLFILIDGALFHRVTGGRYADVIHTWHGHGEGSSYTTGKYHSQPNGPNGGGKLYRRLDSPSQPRLKLYGKGQTKPFFDKPVTHQDAAYSFKQNRLLFRLDGLASKVERIELDATKLGAGGFCGVLRLQAFQVVDEQGTLPHFDESRTDCNEPVPPPQVRFEQIGQSASGSITYRLGGRLKARLPGGSLYSCGADVLVPVGFSMLASPAFAEGRVDNAGQGLQKFNVSGLFSFSGTNPDICRHVGGSGGFQDAAFRHDHWKFSGARSYRIADRGDYRLVVFDSGRHELQYELAASTRSPKHTYRLSADIGNGGKVYFRVSDDRCFMTLDNCGVLFIH